MSSIIIIGAGVIGLSLGWQLSKAKLKVQILEQRQAGRCASWVAAGMLAPYSEASISAPLRHRPLLALCEQSAALFPTFLQQLGVDSQMVLPKEPQGTLYVALSQAERVWLERQYRCKKQQQLPVYWLEQQQLRQKEPLLSARAIAGMWIPSESQVHSQLLLQALLKAFERQGGYVQEQIVVSAVTAAKRGQGYQVLAESGQSYSADIVINAAGAWAGQITPFEACAIRPVKGQILQLKMPEKLSLATMLRTEKVYLVPKSDGSVRIGATSEEQGFDEEVRAGAVLDLLQAAWEVVPAVYEYPLEGVFAGLRPVSSDNMPSIGPCGPKGLYQAIGYGRCGITLAPYTAYQLSQTILRDFSYAGTV